MCRTCPEALPQFVILSKSHSFNSASVNEAEYKKYDQHALIAVNFLLVAHRRAQVVPIVTYFIRYHNALLLGIPS